jgi:DNA-binding SARP family transcriptional activator
MAHLSIHSLGPFHVTLDGDPVTGFESNKVRALLIYLAVESNRPHSRETLAGFLWPDQPEQSARHNLRQALSNLRQIIHDDGAEQPFLQIDRRAVRFNPDSDHLLDVVRTGGRTLPG